jgi:hypothetical protein
MEEQPRSNDRDREAVIADIRSAFADVSRKGGISWSECVVIDNYASDQDRQKARAADRDSHWSTLVEDSNWQPFPGVGGFSFIDEVGFRYYLPATMIRFLQGDISEWYPGHLLFVVDRFVSQLDPCWNAAQLRAIARFVAFMSQHDPDEDGRQMWEKALKSKWSAFL